MRADEDPPGKGSRTISTNRWDAWGDFDPPLRPIFDRIYKIKRIVAEPRAKSFNVRTIRR
jgi:hypothetical protein